MTENHVYGPQSIVNFLLGRKIILDSQGEDKSKIFKIKKFNRHDFSIGDINDMPSNQQKLKEYVLSPDSDIKYIGKYIDFDEMMLDDIDESIRNLNRVKQEIQERQRLELERYKYLRQRVKLYEFEFHNNSMADPVKSIDDLDPNSEELELYNLHQKLKIRYPTGKIKETDQELIDRLQKEGICLVDKERGINFKKQSDIPPDKYFDKYRELLKAINRVYKRNQRQREKFTLSNINNMSTTGVSSQYHTVDISKVFEPMIYNPFPAPNTFQSVNTYRNSIEQEGIILTPGFIMEILPTESSTVNLSFITQTDAIIPSPGFILEILPQSETQTMYFDCQNNIGINPVISENCNSSEYWPEDYEAETDPLKLITWHHFYICNKFVNKLDANTDTTWQEWDIIQDVYQKLASNPLNMGLKSNREEYLQNEIFGKYKQLGRRLPKIEIMSVRRKEYPVDFLNVNSQLISC